MDTPKVPDPLITVVMPVYNAAPYVGAAIEGILAQTYPNWELIIVDDGSSDGSGDVVRSFTDPRIRLFTNDPNRGVSNALNRALSHASGTYVSRHDADDISVPDRYEQQIAYFKAHPEVGLLGGHAITIDKNGMIIGAIDHNPIGNTAIQYALLFDSAFVSSTVVFKRELLEKAGGFDEDRSVWDDYDMWSRLARYTRADNLPVPLLNYRMLETGLTGTTRQAPAMVREQRRRNLKFLVPYADEKLLEPLSYLGHRHPPATTAELRAMRDLLYTAVDRIVPNAADRAHWYADVRARLMGFHVLPRTTRIGAAMDRIYKAMVLQFAPRNAHNQ